MVRGLGTQSLNFFFGLTIQCSELLHLDRIRKPTGQFRYDIIPRSLTYGQESEA